MTVPLGAVGGDIVDALVGVDTLAEDVPVVDMPAAVAAAVWPVSGWSLTADTVPWNVSPGYDSTLNTTGSPGRTPPMSASSISTSTCMRVRSAAIVNKTGAWNADATVCPTSTLRATTIPSIGDVIVVCSRFTCA